MSQSSLLDLIETFYSADFELNDAITLLGNGSPPEAVTPNRLKLAPRDPLYAAVSLETVEPLPPAKEPFLTGLALEYAEPAPMAFSELIPRFGEPRELPRLKPHDPRSYQFLVKGLPREGYLLLFVPLGEEERDLKPVQRVNLRRFPPVS